MIKIATTKTGSLTKYKLNGDVSKTLTVDDDYFENLSDPENLTKKIGKIYDSDTTITGFTSIYQDTYTVA